MPASLSTDPPAPHEPVALERVVELIAPALGKEKSEELILSSARNLGYSTDALDLERTLEILSELGSQPGIVGVSARFAKSRILSPRKKPSSTSIPRQDRPAVPPDHATISPRQALTLAPEGPTPAERTTSIRVQPGDIAALLSHTLGTEKSREVLAIAMTTLGIADGPLDQQQGLSILEVIAKAQGIVGVVARFAKARLILRFEGG